MAPTLPMGWMTWNYCADAINEKDIRDMADAMVSSGMLKEGYNHVFIDDGWQGGKGSIRMQQPLPVQDIQINKIKMENSRAIFLCRGPGLRWKFFY